MESRSLRRRNSDAGVGMTMGGFGLGRSVGRRRHAVVLVVARGEKALVLFRMTTSSLSRQLDRYNELVRSTKCQDFGIYK